MTAGRTVAAALAEGARRGRPREGQRGPDAKQAERDYAQQKREQDHTSVERDGLEPRQRCGGERDAHPRQPERQHDARRDTGDAKQREFGEHLPHNPGSAAAERRPNRHFVSPRSRLTEKKTCHVGAGNQQQ